MKINPVSQASRVSVLSDGEVKQLNEVLRQIEQRLRDERGEACVWIRNVSDRVARATARMYTEGGWTARAYEYNGAFVISVKHPNLIEPPLYGGRDVPEYRHTIDIPSVTPPPAPVDRPAE